MNAKDLATWQRLRRLALRVHLGPRAGVRPRAHSLLRYLAPRGDQAGQRREGRLRDYLFVLSALKERTLFRRREIAPLRRLHLVLDVRDGPAEWDRRLRHAADLVGGFLLALPGGRFSLSAWGTRDPFPMQLFAGDGQWPWFRRVVAGVLDQPVEPRASAGALQRAAATEEPAHLVLLSPWVEPAHVRGLPAPLGGTCFLVEPSRSVFAATTVGVSDPLLAVQPPDAAAARDEDRYSGLGRACRERRFELIRLPPRDDLLEGLERALTGA